MGRTQLTRSNLSRGGRSRLAGSSSLSGARSGHMWRDVVVCSCVAMVVTTGQGCAGGAPTRSDATNGAKLLPPDSVAAVGTKQIPRAMYLHWLPILRRLAGAKRAPAATLSFLIKAQWLRQEIEVEGLRRGALARVVAARIRGTSPSVEMSRADQAFRVSLDVIAEALEQKHLKSRTQISPSAVSRYWRAHRSQFARPAVRHTRMIVAGSLQAAEAARVAIAASVPWRLVAKHWSEDSSAAIAGRAEVAAGGGQPPKLERAVFASPLDRLVGPLKIPVGRSSRFYLFEVFGERRRSLEPLKQAEPGVREHLTEETAHHALVAFERTFEQKWRSRTVCRSELRVPQCGTYTGMTTPVK